MGLSDQAIADWQKISSDTAGFGVSMTFRSAGGTHTATVSGLFTKHHLSVDGQGIAVNARHASVSIAEKLLTDAGYPTRTYGRVTLKDHTVSVADSSGTTYTYTVQQWHPDEKLGCILIILGDYIA